jgi:DNA-binding response OmpR family regulator
VLAGQVRHKIEDNPSQPRIVLTVPGLGYQFGGDRDDDAVPAAAPRAG